MSDDRKPVPDSITRRRLLQGLSALPLAGFSGLSFAQQYPTAAVNTTKLAVTDTEVIVGQLHSATGTMAISETGSIQAEQLAIDQINAMGGVLGRKIKVIKEDGASDWPTFAEKAQKLISEDRVAATFGCWTSASRKAVKPVFEKNKSLLFYPVQYEGLEESPYIFYTGATTNQQIIPALDYLKSQGKKRIYLVGSDYVFPRTANKEIKAYAKANGMTVLGEDYAPLGSTEFSTIANKVKASKADAVFNTLNGDSNVAFFKEYKSAGLTAKGMPVVSVSIAEEEALSMGPDLVKGSYAAWNYFQTLDSPENAKFIAAYKAKYGAEKVTSDPMMHGYVDVYIWKAAVEKAGSFDPAKVRAAAVTLDAIPTPLGPVKFVANNSLVQTGYIGQLDSAGKFKVVWHSPAPIEPEPYDPVTFPGKTCTIT